MGSKVWPKAVVSDQLDEHSYITETDKGTYQRNLINIKKTQEEQLHIEPSEEPPGTHTEEVKSTPVMSATSSEPDTVKRHTRSRRNTKEPAYNKYYLTDYVRKSIEQ